VKGKFGPNGPKSSKSDLFRGCFGKMVRIVLFAEIRSPLAALIISFRASTSLLVGAKIVLPSNHFGFLILMLRLGKIILQNSLIQSSHFGFVGCSIRFDVVENMF